MKSCLPSVLVFLTAATATSAVPKSVGVRHSLLSEVEAIAPGQTFTVALFLDHTDSFHTYWKNPGTAGLATSLKWTLPKGFEASPIRWQVPEKVKMVIYDAYGYNSDAMLLVDIKAPEKLPKEPVILKAKAVWMACGPEPKQCCNLGFQDLSLSLKTANMPKWNNEWRARIAKARKKLPKPIKGWKQSAKRDGEKVILTVQNIAGVPVEEDQAICFYSELNHFTTLKKQRLKVKGDELIVTLPLADYAPEKLEEVKGLLYHPQGWQGSKGKKYMPLTLRLD
ncbi:protein-disulfide reductase DsbD family protein [Opitutales bacterium]|jgi:DsbC/DsbD-like thiol-disulfide interchange protein|nr:protein-disulfide reductase DsbD family protein [Opitutales bacterium]